MKDNMQNKQFPPQQIEKNVIFVSDLPSNVIESDLWVFFEKVADKIVLLTLNANKNPIDIYHPMSAKIIFKDFEAADYARKEMNLRKLKGKAVRIMWDERDNSIRYNSMTNLFVNYIPISIKPRDVYEYFLQFGDISSAKLNEDINGNHMGYGYVTYYSAESAHKAIMETDGKIVWGSKLEVKYFQKKTERMATFGQANTKIFISNLPGNFPENVLGQLCSKYGDVYSISKDKYNNAIVTFTNEESPLKAKVGLDKTNISGYTITVELYEFKKQSRTPLDKNSNHYQSQLNEMKTQLDQYRNCNLHVRNIPFHAKESEIKTAFAKYGDLRSVKIEIYALMTKVNNEFKEIPTSKGFGYVCFEKEESATKAMNEMNGKFLPGYESWNKPLLIEIFKTKTERNIFNQVNPYQQPIQPGVLYYPMPIMSMGSMPPPQIQHQTPINTNTSQVTNQQPQKTEEKKKTNDPIDRNHFNSIESIEEKKEYLGEIIFKKIEDHRLAQENNMSIDTIGKITGMILNIDEIDEIIDICINDNFLTIRIEEAWELLKK